MLQPNFRKVAFIFDHSISIEFKSGLYGGRYVPRGCNWGAPYFNSRPSARGDGQLFVPALHSAHFNSRPSARGDGARRLALRSVQTFQFPPLREGRLEQVESGGRGHYFNSRPSARGDGCSWMGSSMGHVISIPAPPRGATTLFQQAALVEVISIPAPPRGATERRKPSLRRKQFQFPPLREGRRQKICNFCKSFVQPSQITAL